MFQAYLFQNQSRKILKLYASLWHGNIKLLMLPQLHVAAAPGHALQPHCIKRNNEKQDNAANASCSASHKLWMDPALD